MLLGEEICIAATQFANWDKSATARMSSPSTAMATWFVVEIKRDKLDAKDQDLQAIRYASYAAGLDSEEIVSLYRDYRLKEHEEELSEAEATEQLSAFISEGLSRIDDEAKPRMILVSSGFSPLSCRRSSGCEGSSLWARRKRSRPPATRRTSSIAQTRSGSRARAQSSSRR
jgi:hypothetical protein